MAQTKKKKKGLSANAKWGIAFIVEIFIAAIMGVGYLFFYANAKLNKIVKVELKEEELAINEGSNEAQKGYTTIALFGIDARSTDSGEISSPDETASAISPHHRILSSPMQTFAMPELTTIACAAHSSAARSSSQRTGAPLI